MMKGRRIGDPAREENLETCQKSRQNCRVSFLLLAICALIPNPTISAPVQIHGISVEKSQGISVTEDPEGDVPVFEPTAANVSAFEGQTVYLPCRVRNLGDKTVSWMRSRDLHILTTSDITFSSDSRFSPQHSPGSDAWTLRLDRAKKADSGKYECQVNTEPKIMYAVQLFVRDPEKPEGYDEPFSQQTRISYESTAPIAEIVGPDERRVPSGSTITLRCVITSPYQTRPIKGVQWLRDDKLLTILAKRGGINVETEKSTTQTISSATLASVTEEDTGKYSCRPTEGLQDTITLIVDPGERTEAMQRDAGYISSGSDIRCWSRLLLPLAWLLTIARNRQTFLH